MVKLCVKHGWAIKYRYRLDACLFESVDGGPLPSDVEAAISNAVRNIAGRYRVDVTESNGVLYINRTYTVTPAGQFKEVKLDTSGKG